MPGGVSYRQKKKSLGAAPQENYPIDDDGVPLVKGSLKYFKTAVLNTPVAGGKPDAIHFSGDTTVQFVGADNTDAEPVTLALAGGVFHPISVRSVLALTNGVTATLGWFVKP